MKITWLGQSGLLLEYRQEKIMIDPYLSDSVEKSNLEYRRRMPVNPSFLNINPSMIILTHDHLDHTDPNTLCYYLRENSKITVLASENAWQKARSFGGNQNYVLFNRHTQLTENGLRYTAIHAEHSDKKAIGVLIETLDSHKCFCITGDTLYNNEVIADIPKCVDVLFLPINGYGNNMNMIDAERLARKIKAKMVVPLHWGLFDNIDPCAFRVKHKVIPEIYKEIKI